MKNLKTERAMVRLRNKFWLTIFGALMGILAFFIFILDRVFMSVLIWIPLPTIKQFYNNEKLVMISLFRVIITAILIGLVYLIQAIL